MKSFGTFSLVVLALLVLMTGCQSTTGQSEGGGKGTSDIGSGGGQALLTKEWEETPIPFFISQTVPEEFVPPILESFATWEKVAGRKLFDYQGRTDSSKKDFDGQNVVYWDPHSHPKGYLGETYFMTLDRREMIESDVVFFGDPARFAPLSCPNGEGRCRTADGKFDITTTALHEIGHVLGFDHSTVEGELMNPAFGLNTVVHDFDAPLVSELQGLYNPTLLATK